MLAAGLSADAKEALNNGPLAAGAQREQLRQQGSWFRLG
jgi:hypothetical protein